MRLDKYLKVTHIVKRREVAHDFIAMGKALVNDKVAKPATDVKENDIITLNISETRIMKIKVLEIKEHASIKESKSLYQIIQE